MRKRSASPGRSLSYDRATDSISLGEWPNDERAGHRRSVAAVKFLAESFLDDIPTVAHVRIGFEILQSLVDDLAVPIRHGDRLGRGRDSVPE